MENLVLEYSHNVLVKRYFISDLREANAEKRRTL